MIRVMQFSAIALFLWIGAELYTEGPAGAFGGVLAGWVEEDESGTPGNAADAFQRAYDSSESRVDRMLEENDAPH